MTTPDPLAAAERRRRDLASAAKRLRVAVMTDPARAGEFADTLVALVGNRLLAWSFTDAAADAPESVVLSARILAERGPLGPYASADDAVRYFTASVQLAAVQAGLGQPEAAGRTLDALDAWRAQLGRLPLLEQLAPLTVVWALAVRARAAQEVAAANGYADAALLRLYAAGLDLDAGSAYLAVTAHLVAADARWAAGHPDAALAQHRLALARYRAAVAGADAGARPALVQTVLAPLPDLFAPFALRLEGTGDQAGAIAVLREWVALAERLADDAAVQVAGAALGGALARAGRDVEAEQYGPATSAGDLSLPVPGARIDWPALPPQQVLSTGGLTVTASVRLQRDEQDAAAQGAAARANAELGEAGLRARAEQRAAEQAAERAAAQRQAAAQAEAAAREAAERARLEAQAEAERRAAQELAEQAAAAERRRERAAAREDARAVQPELLQASAAELPSARQQVIEAGGEPALAAAQERLAALLRPLATADPDGYRDELLATLEALVSLRWRLGDPEGSREAARERKSW